MSRLPPVPPAGRPTRGPEAAPKTSADVTHRLRRQARQHEDATAAETTAGTDSPGPSAATGRAATRAPDAALISGISRPMLDLGLAGFAGYVFGYLMARRRR